MIGVSLEACLHRVFVDARRARHATVSEDHLLLALLDDATVADALRACGVDLEALRGELQAVVRVHAAVVAGTDPVDPQPSPEFRRVLTQGISHVMVTRGRIARSHGLPKRAWQAAAAVLRPFGMAVGDGTVDGTDVLVALFAEPDSLAVQALHRHGATRLDVTRLLAHGRRKSDPPEPDPAAIGDLDVVLLNDDFTPMAFVVALLRDQFGMTLEAATGVMREIHQRGRTACGRFPAADALARVARLRHDIERAGHPLRCVAAPVSTGRQGGQPRALPSPVESRRGRP